MLTGEAVPIPEAARRLGIGVEGIRKRLQRGSLQHYKQHGRVMVMLPPEVIEEASRQMVPTGDGQLVEVRADLQMLIGLVQELSEQNGQLKAELAQARGDIKALQRTILTMARERAGNG